MKDKLNICLVGVGRVASSHLPAIRNLSDSVNLVAIMSRDRENAEKAAEQWSAKRVYTSYEKMLKDPEIEAVVLCLPHYIHEGATVEAAKAKKHVLCEKPMAINTEQALNMIRAAEENGVTLMIGQSRRFYDAVLKSKEMVMEGKLGRIVSVNEWNFSHRVEDHPSTWRPDIEKSGGRIMPFWGAHLVDYVLWIFDKRPQTVSARMASINPNWEGEDEAMVLMGFDGEEMGFVHLSWNCRIIPTHTREEVTGKIWDSKKNSVYERYIVGEKGTLYMNDETELYFNGDLIMSGPQVPSNFTLQLREFATAIKDGREPIASGEEVLKVVETMDAAFKSAAENCLVKMEDQRDLGI
jgi:predicted dehydrogenase